VSRVKEWLRADWFRHLERALLDPIRELCRPPAEGLRLDGVRILGAIKTAVG
jgi:hypothetical protein